MFASKRWWVVSNQGLRYETAEYQGLGGWKVESNQGASEIKEGLVGVIELSGRKLDSRRPGTGLVGASKRSRSEQSERSSDWRTS